MAWNTLAGFLKMKVQGTPAPQTPVLLRIALPELSPATMMNQEAYLNYYPGNFLIGGPTQYGILTSPMGRAWIEGLRGWAMMNNRGFAYEIVPIVPDGYAGAPRWPRQGWAWEYIFEQGPAQPYKLVMVSIAEGRWVEA